MCVNTYLLLLNQQTELKKMNRLIILALMLMASVQAMIMGAEHLTDAHIQGHAVEQGTGEHIPFLTVRLLGTNIGTNTDAT